MPDACWPTSVSLAGVPCLVHAQGGILLPRHRMGEGLPAGSAGKSSMGPGLQQGKAPPRGCQGWRARHPGALRQRASPPPPPGAACAQLCDADTDLPLL